MDIDVLICSFNKGIVRIADMLPPPVEGLRYVISFQYTHKQYLSLVPSVLRMRSDVCIHSFQGQGLSNNRNRALEYAKSDLILYLDDDSQLLPEAISTIRQCFTEHPEIDIACFQATTYTHKPLKAYPSTAFRITALPTAYSISTIEMVFRRTKVQTALRYDERFGLDTKFLTCGEEEIWLIDALRKGLHLHYFPRPIIETSTLLTHSMIYVDAGVQRSKGASLYYQHGLWAYFLCFRFALDSALRGYCHFVPMFLHLCQGISFLKKN